MTAAASPDLTFAPAETSRSDSDRIRSEILGPGRGTDPFVAAVRATHMPMIVTDAKLPDNPVVFANDAFCHLTGYDREEIVGRNCRFLQGAETDPETVRRLHDTVAAGGSIEVDIRNYRKGGEPFWNRLMLAPVHDDDGAIAYFVASQVDVTVERHRVEGLESRNAALAAEIGQRVRANAESEERLRHATEAAGLGIWELDLATSQLYTSRSCRANFGRDEALPFSYEALREAIHPDDRERMAASVAHSIATGDDYRIDYRIARPDGQPAWLQVSATVQRGDDGTPRRMVGTSRDITAARALDEQNRVLLELDRTVFSTLENPSEIAYEAVAALGRTLGVSRAGYGTIDKVNETITIERDWNAPGIQSLAGTLQFRDYGAYIDDLQRGESVVIDDARLDPRTADTAAKLAAISALSFINMPVIESGDFVALLYLNHATARHWTAAEQAFMLEVATRTRQVVERRRAEQRLRALATSLESQVADRTASLLNTEAALRQAQKMEAVGQLTGGLAHDFNNILAAISGSLELLQRKKHESGSPAFERLLNTARSATRKAASLTHRLLAFSRQQTLEPKHLNANRLVGGMEELVRRTIGPDIELEVVSAVGLWTVEVDPSQLENSLLNLCINARDAMPEGGKLTIETANRWIDERVAVEQQVAPGQYVSMCVSDNGTGMPPEVIARAFDPFFTTKPMGMGTGLGLSMVYGFAKQSDGHVRIYSELGQGTTVCVYLPRREGTEAAEDNPLPLPPDARADVGETVLVVDDDEMVRTLTVETLQELGYTVLEAADGLAATDILRSTRRIDLLVTDVGLPGGMNGRQVADAARMARPALQVLFITGYAENAVLGHGHLDPGMHIMTKPFELTALGNKVKLLVDRATAAP